MNSFKAAYNESKQEKLTEKQALYEQQKTELLNAIKKEYAINSFSTLNESQKAKVRSMINVMWSPETGINKKGEMFLNEGKKPLSKESDPELICREFQREVKANIEKVIHCIAMGDNKCETLSQTKDRIESEIGRKLSTKALHDCIREIVMPYINKKINGLKF